jgi:hypothetical protein
VRGDFNHDGKIDLASGNSDGTVTILVNNGNGTFHRLDAVAGTGGVGDLFAIDVNKDGTTDLLAVVPVGDNKNNNLNLLIGRGDGTFNAPVTIATRENGQAVAAADFNGDGNIDVAFGWNASVANPAAYDGISRQANVTLLFGDGHGAFPTKKEMTAVGAQADYANGESGYQISYMNVGDFNGDGKADFAIAECCGGFDVELGAASLYLNNGAGSFTEKALGGAPPHEARVFDLDKNGISDLLVPYAGCHTPCVGVHAMLNPGTTSATGQDLPDPFVQSPTGGESEVFYSATGGKFLSTGPRMAVYSASGVRYDPPTYQNDYYGAVLAFASWNGSAWTLVKTIDTYDRAMRSIVSGDFNGDGLDDLAAIEISSNYSSVPPTVRVMLNTSGTTSTGPCSVSTNRTVKICSPASGSTVTSPVHVLAGVRSDSGVTAAQIYVDGTKVYQGGAGTTTVDQSLTLSSGSHKITVKGWDSTGSFSSSETITVSGTQTTTCTATTNRTVKICEPTSGSTVSSPVHVLADVRSGSGVTGAKVYLDGTAVYTGGAGTTTVSQWFYVGAGSHRFTVKGWDSSGSFSSSVTVTVK